MEEDFRKRVEGERAYLLRYASLQLRDRQAAEDAVQETLLAALAGESGFAGRSNLRTWLTGILKHKIIDAIRRASRDGPAPEADAAELDERSSTGPATGRSRRRPGRIQAHRSSRASSSPCSSNASSACPPRPRRPS